MKTNAKRLLALVLVLALCLSLLPATVSAEGDYVQVTSLSQLTSGQYLLTNTGYAATVLDGSWVNVAAIDTQTFSNADATMVWTLTVDGTNVTLTDSNGTSIAPKSGNTNGISSGSYRWAVAETDGAFTFSGQGADTTMLACNKGSDYKIRAYKTSTVTGNPTSYPSSFTLYRVGGGTPDPVPEDITKLTPSAAYTGIVTEGTVVTLSCAGISGETYEVSTDGTWTAISGNTYTIPANVTSVSFRAVKDGAYSKVLTLDVAKPSNVTPIATVRAAADGEFTVEATVVYISGRNVYVQDATGGLCLYFSAAPSLTLGQVVRATGSRASYNGLEELSGVTEYEVIGTDTLPCRTVTLAELLADTANTLECTRVALYGLTVGTVNVTGNTPLSDEKGNSMNAYRAAALETFQEGDVVNVIAVVGDYNGYQLLVESAVSAESDAGEFTVDAELEQAVAHWGGGGPYTEAQKTAIPGDRYQIGDMLDTTAEFTILANGKSAKPYQQTTTSTGGYNYYMGGANVGQAAGDYLQLRLSTAGWAQLRMSFRMRTTNAGPGFWQLQYSTDGGSTFTNFTTGSYSYAYTAYGSGGTSYEVSGSGEIYDGIAKTSLAAANYVSFSFDVPNGAANCSNLLIRLVAGNTRTDGKDGSISGNVRIDSVEIKGNPIVSDQIVGYVTVEPDSSEDQAPGTELTMTSTTEGAAIYYTFVDGEGKAMGAAQVYDPANKPVLPSKLPVYLVVHGEKSGLQNSVERIFTYAAGSVSSVRFTPNGGGVYLGAGDVNVTLSCETEGAAIYYAIGEGEFQLYDPASTRITLTTGFGSLTVRAYASKEGFKDSPVSTRTFTERAQETYNIYFGQMHSHTSYSDGAGTAEDAFSHASQVANLDFLAVTDHSNSYDNAANSVLSEDASRISSEWAEGKALAQKYTTDTFVGFLGFEMTWSNGLGHMNTFNTPGFQSRTQSEYTTYATALQNYYATLETVSDSISQFNHPGTTFGDFSDFSYFDEEIDQLITLIEVGNGEGAIGSNGYFPSYEYYTRALDKGWHVAPTNNQDNHKGLWGDANTGRSVVLSDSLTEADIYDAMRNYRVYATEDNDLSVYYTLDDNIMGSILTKEDVGDSLTLTVKLDDPTDSAIGKVEVIVNGGLSIASTEVSGNSDTVTFTVGADYSYYYIRITQKDGDIAVTAPVWVGTVEAVGISDFSTTAALAVQNQPLDLNLELYNNEKTALTVTKLEFSVVNAADETVVIKTLTGSALTDAGIDTVKKLSTVNYSFDYTYSGLGKAEFYATVTGLLNGVEKVYTEKLELNYVSKDMVTRVVIDGSHYNDYVTGYYGGNMGNFTAMAAEESILVTIAGADKSADDRTLTEAEWKELLSDCSLLVVSAPARSAGTANAGAYSASSFEDWFLTLVSDFVKDGGSLVVCGLADYQDKGAASADNHIAAQMNRLLTAAGSTMTVNDDEAYDEVNNGGQAYRLYPESFKMDSKWLAGVVAAGTAEHYQTYSQYSGCTVDAGSGEALVMGFDTTYSIDSDKDGKGGVKQGEAVFLAAEDTAYGGTIFAAGGVFVSDFDVDYELDNAFDLPYANTTIAKNILQAVKKQLPVTPIAEVRQVANTGSKGDVFRVVGYVTAGTANEHNAFFDSIYVQDATGGIDVFPYAVSGLELGTKIEVVGYLDSYQGDLELQLMSATILDAENLKPVEPTDLTCAQASDYAAYGGLLIRATGTVKPGSIYYNADGTLAQFVLTDATGETTIFIDGYIRSGTTGENTLADSVKEGCTVSAVGLQYMHPEVFVPGVTDSVSVLRVRNCDEIIVQSHTHAFGEWTQTKAPTCTEAGEETRSCGCGETETRAIQALGHKEVVDAAVAPTCTEAGKTEGKHCERCGEVLAAQQTVAPLGHAWDEGKVTTEPTATEKGVKTFTCTRCGATRTESIPATGVIQLPFTDVKETDYFYEPVAWAVSKGITNGVTATRFGPDSPCTRAQVVTFLWRAAGSPEPTGKVNPFTDVNTSDYFYKAVMWALEKGITTGVTATRFGPSSPCTRAQVVTFQYRANGCPKPQSTVSFTDVAKTDYFYDAVAWAVENGITNGVAATRFGPHSPCTRAQIVTFLYREAH